MKIFIKRSGGFANIGPIQGELEALELFSELAREIEFIDINVSKIKVRRGAFPAPIPRARRPRYFPHLQKWPIQIVTKCYSNEKHSC